MTLTDVSTTRGSHHQSHVNCVSLLAVMKTDWSSVFRGQNVNVFYTE